MNNSSPFLQDIHKWIDFSRKDAKLRSLAIASWWNVGLKKCSEDRRNTCAISREVLSARTKMQIGAVPWKQNLSHKMSLHMQFKRHLWEINFWKLLTNIGVLAKHFYENTQYVICINLSWVLWFCIQSHNVYKVEEHGEPVHCFNRCWSNGLGIIYQPCAGPNKYNHHLRRIQGSGKSKGRSGHTHFIVWWVRGEQTKISWLPAMSQVTAKVITSIISLQILHSSMSQMLLSSFHRWENWHWERLSYISKNT